MNDTVQQTLTDTLDYLMTLVQKRVRPEEARSGMRPLQKRHSDVGMQLIWEEEGYDRSVHYDALLKLPGGTISLSYCDDRAMPWPMRGVHRWTDADLVRVNNKVLTVDQAIACLDFIWDESRIADRLVNVCLIQEELENNPIDLSDEELQVAMDGFRRARKLYKAADTHTWMERRGLTHPEFEKLVISQATVAKLRDNLVTCRVQDYFDAHRADFDTAYVSRILLSDETSALETFENIRSGDLDFFEAAQRRFVEASRSSQVSRDIFGVVRRYEAPAGIRESLFTAGPGAVLGPVREDDGYVIMRVLSLAPANLDESTHNTIKKILFDEWLEERRRSATIDWLWGNASRTGQVAEGTK